MRNQHYIALLWLLGLFAIPLGIIPSQVMNYLTDLLQPGVAGEDISILPIIALFLLSVIGMALIDVVRSVVTSLTLESIVRTKSLALFDHVLRANAEFFRKNQTAKISNRIVNELRGVESVLLDIRIGLPITLLGVLAFCYVMFFGLDSSTPVIGSYLPEGFSQQGNWFFGLLVVVLSPLQVVFLLFDRKIQKVQRATAEADDAVAEIAHETVSNVREIRNTFSFNYAIARMAKVFEHLRKVEIDIAKMHAVLTGVNPVINGLVKVTLLAVGARLCVGDLQLPLIDVTVEAIQWKDYMGFAGIALIMDNYVGRLRDYLFKWRMSKDSVRRIEEFRQAELMFNPDIEKEFVDGAQDSVRFDRLSFDTDDGTRILQDLSVDIQPGEHVALVGPSGCGKSTAMNLLLRELKRSTGGLTFGAKEIEKCRFESLSAEIGFVQQQPMLLNTSIRNNLLLGLRRESAQTLLDDGAPVDVSRFDNCNHLDDLDQQLLHVIRQVALDRDVMRKALDNPLPDAASGTDGLHKVLACREAIRERLRQHSTELIQAFQPEIYLKNSTLIENLLFGILPEPSADGLRNQEPLKPVIAALQGTDLLPDLLLLGKQLFFEDQRIAMRIRHHTPALFDVLSTFAIAEKDESTEDLAAAFEGSAGDDADRLQKLDSKLQKTLLEIALTTSAGQALELADDGDRLRDRVLATRKILAERETGRTFGSVAFSSDAIAGHVPFREYLIGGQVRTDLRNAVADVDRVVIEVLEQQGVLGDLMLLGLEASVGENGKALSGGQAQKVAIARVLLKKPSILLLDEATSALDEKSQARIVDIIEDDYADKTVVMISHRLSTIVNFSRVLVFDRGQIVQQGRYDELVNAPGLFQTLVNQEQGKEVAAPAPTAVSSEPGSTTSDIQRLLAMNPLFSSLHSEDLALLERMSDRIRCGKGEILFERGDPGDEYFVILTGEVEFFARDEHGERIVVDTLGAGASFGELALFGGIERTLGACAAEDTELAVLTRDDLVKLMEINPAVSMEFLAMISRQVGDLRRQAFAD